MVVDSTNPIVEDILHALKETGHQAWWWFEANKMIALAKAEGYSDEEIQKEIKLEHDSWESIVNVVIYASGRHYWNFRRPLNKQDFGPKVRELIEQYEKVKKVQDTLINGNKKEDKFDGSSYQAHLMDEQALWPRKSLTSIQNYLDGKCGKD